MRCLQNSCNSIVIYVLHLCRNERVQLKNARHHSFDSVEWLVGLWASYKNVNNTRFILMITHIHSAACVATKTLPIYAIAHAIGPLNITVILWCGKTQKPTECVIVRHHKFNEAN